MFLFLCDSDRHIRVWSRLVPAYGGPATDSDDPDHPDLKIPKNSTKPVILVLHRFYTSSSLFSTVSGRREGLDGRRK